ncbi:MAG: methyltransferase domain-containing protein [Blastocatellia bacterium]
MTEEITEQVAERISDSEMRLNHRADDYEHAVDSRIEERFGAFQEQTGQRFADLQRQSDERGDNYEAALDARIDERLAQAELRLDGRIAEIESHLDERIDEIESRTDLRMTGVESRTDVRMDEIESRSDERLAEIDARLEVRFEQRSRATDNRLDDRFAKTERQIDERFGGLDQRTDERMERHERKTDAMIRQFSTDIVERNDVMLHLFEQRLDKQRRELKQIQETGRQHSTTEQASTESANETEGEADESHRQLISFRKMANVATNAQAKIQASPAGNGAPLYHQILDWKKVAHEGMDRFSPDEREVVDYILSFLDDPKELHYVTQHLRRFVSTLQRIPPAQRSTDQLLELGSLSHIAPAIKKYCGYAEVHCADFWTADEKITHETVMQKHPANGHNPESHSFELRNFNVERDAFPYQDGQFHAVICCELIEHLQSDPMHMLWECNRVLEPDGWFVLTTPNIASCRAIEGLLVGCAPYLLAQYNVREIVDQHNREYAPYEIGVALAAAGFTVIELETEDVWSRSNPAILDLLKQVQISTELRGDNIFALAKKTSAPIERYPKELYID